MTGVLSMQHVSLLRSLYSDYNSEIGKKGLILLNQFREFELSDVKVIVLYHDVLLFFRAYPPDKKLLSVVNSELERIRISVKKIMESNNYSAHRILSGTAIPGTLLIGQFSFSITKWLANIFPGLVYPESVNAGRETGNAILYSLLPAIEYYFTTQGKFSLKQRLTQLIGKNEFQLQKVVKLFESINRRQDTTDLLFDQMKIFTEWKLDHPFFNRSFIAGLSHPIFYHKNLKKNFEINKIINKPLSVSASLSISEKRHLINTARASLAFYYRETDPVTYADEKEIKFFYCDRGISIALFGMKPEKRLSIESYIGYMAFKNTVPVAYGGGWIFGERCKIGVNIFPPFRGGESALIFSEVIRTYFHYFNIRRFIVKPYQFGKGNKEGLHSGAFWFYYKLGFRPADPVIARLAEEEYVLKKKTAIDKLRKFTRSNMEMLINPVFEKDFDPALVSKAITKMITTRFNGNRTKAIKTLSKSLKAILGLNKNFRLTELRTIHFNYFGLMLSLLPDFKNWNSKDKRKLIQVISLKSSAGERKYILYINKHPKLINSLYSLFN